MKFSNSCIPGADQSVYIMGTIDKALWIFLQAGIIFSNINPKKKTGKYDAIKEKDSKWPS